MMKNPASVTRLSGDSLHSGEQPHPQKAGLLSPPWGDPRALYIHVPFCRHRCGYCDFTLVAGRDDLIGRYLDALELELAQTLPEPVEIDTVFFGGGTPTHLDSRQLTRLFSIARECVRLADGFEFSVEANPLDLTPERIAVLREAGVNRVSVGVQSFDANELRLLERDHSPAEARDAIVRLQRVIPNVGIDLIFGVPGQSLADWLRNFEAALELRPTHLSTYGLTFEKGTAFWTRREQGGLRQAPEDLERLMYEAAMDRAPAAGLPQYELSNFARPGFECRHNQTYWEARAYYAVGPGAASYLNGVRRTNHRSTTTWLKKTAEQKGRAPTAVVEELTAEERAREAVMLGLRQTRGINAAEFERRFGFRIEDLGGRAYPRLVEAGWLEDRDGRIRLTREGRCVADTVISEFLA